jgi:hypothetical protein
VKKKSSQFYFSDLNELLMKSEQVSEEMHPYFEKAEHFFDQGGEFSEKEDVLNGFEQGMSTYKSISEGLAGLTPNVKAIGLHRQLTKNFIAYVNACDEMVEATRQEDVSAFKRSEKSQEEYSDLVGKLLNRIIRIAM